MPYVRLTRRYRFSASHRLHSPVFSEEANQAIYGKCNNPFGHGHDYELEVTVAGPVDPRLGRLVPIEMLDEFVRTVVIDRLDRRNLNVEVEEFASLVPTTENLAVAVARRLGFAWPLRFTGSTAGVEKVVIHETRRNIFEVTVSAAAGQSPAGWGAAESETAGKTWK